MSIELTNYELRLIHRLRDRNPAERIPTHETPKAGQRFAVKVTRVIGSWRFIVIQSILLVIWLILNTIAYIEHWDAYPFILLNLMLSFQAAYTAPVILMSQNREAEIDRQKLSYYYEVNLKSELEIELLQQKMDDLMEIISNHVGVPAPQTD
jgi:uncharacterized membrane protein